MADNASFCHLPHFPASPGESGIIGYRSMQLLNDLCPQANRAGTPAEPMTIVGHLRLATVARASTGSTVELAGTQPPA